MTAAIIDYGSGNLRSAAKALERAAAGSGLGVAVTSDPEVVRRADRVVLPGVGAFGDCRRGLEDLAGMVEVLREAVLVHGRPFLGICVGMQLMADRGLEHGTHEGLGWIPGEVVALEPDEPRLKVPHMGWNDMEIEAAAHPLLEDLPDRPHFYFDHSYHFHTREPAHRLGRVDYGGPVTAMVGRDNMIGTQFHPEKSQAVGLTLLHNFLRWRP